MTTSSEKTNAKPTHMIRQRIWKGNRNDFETLGAAWQREDGSLYIKLYGKQIVDSGFYVFSVKDGSSEMDNTQEGGQ